jgi:pyruvate carboxylase subunit B
MLEVAEAGADVLDVAIEPLSWGKVHPDVITIQAMLKDAGFLVKDINMKAYMQARALTQEFIDDFLGYFMDPTNKHMSSLLLKCGLPGGMMGSMMADMKGMMPVINMSLKAQDKPEMTLDEVVIKLFDEVEYVWPKVGYPPLVTPFSQYVKNIALMNILAEAQGKARYSLLTDKSIWGMILGKSGQLPGEVAPEIKELAKEQGLEFFTGDVQALYPDNMDTFRKEMEENGWETGPDDEELFEFAMHPEQYRPFKSGVAKERFEADLQKAKDAAMAKQGFSMEDVLKMKRAKAEPIEALEKGQILWEIDREQQSIAPTVGTKFTEGDHFCYIQTPWGLKEIFANFTGKIIEVCVKQGETADKGDVLAYIERTDKKEA